MNHVPVPLHVDTLQIGGFKFGHDSGLISVIQVQKLGSPLTLETQFKYFQYW